MGFDPLTWEGVALLTAATYAGSQMGKGGARIKPPPPPPTAGPTPTTVMAAKRVEDDRAAALKKRRQVSVMGGDYGALNIQTTKLGT